jgi:hypothetical protein
VLSEIEDANALGNTVQLLGYISHMPTAGRVVVADDDDVVALEVSVQLRRPLLAFPVVGALAVGGGCEPELGEDVGALLAFALGRVEPSLGRGWGATEIKGSTPCKSAPMQSDLCNEPQRQARDPTSYRAPVISERACLSPFLHFLHFLHSYNNDGLVVPPTVGMR